MIPNKAMTYIGADFRSIFIVTAIRDEIAQYNTVKSNPIQSISIIYNTGTCTCII